MLQQHAAIGALTPLNTVLHRLLEGLSPVNAEMVALHQACGCVAADEQLTMPPLPPANRAEIDGWAFRAIDLSGASAFSPVMLAAQPAWVAEGETLPDGCDCLLEPSLVQPVGPQWQVIGDAVPGQGIRRVGEDCASGQHLLETGRRISPADLLLARSHGLSSLRVRRPVVQILELAPAEATAQFVAEWAYAQGARCLPVETCRCDAQSIAGALQASEADLVVLVGGTGAHDNRKAIEALAAHGTLIAHGIALSPGRMTAVARAGNRPVIALPALASHAIAGCLGLVAPALRRLSGAAEPWPIALPLARKISSTVGIAEIALLKLQDEGWMPVAAGDLPLVSLSVADAWLILAATSEGYSAGTVVGAFPLHVTGFT